MNNENAGSQLELCDSELRQIEMLIEEVVGSTGTLVKYLTKYALIRSCGAIEFSYKTIIADFDQHTHNEQIRNFLQSKVRESSSNPSIDNILNTLKSFDEGWKNALREKINSHPDRERIRSSMQSLVTLRNEFAHGGSPVTSFNSIYEYYKDGKLVLEMLDSIVNASSESTSSI